MPDRYREIIHRHPGGTYGRFGNSYTTEFTDSYSKISDIVGPGDNAPFTVNKFDVSGGVIEKPYTGFFSSYFNNYTCDYIQGIVFGIEPLPLDNMSTVEAATRGAARTNPSRPSVDMPTELLQIHQIPDIIRQAGQNELGRVGGANLGYQFGVRPIINDVTTLSNVQKLIADRADELLRAERAGGIKRTVVVDASSNEESRLTYLQTDGLFIREPVNWWTGETVSVHSRWVPDGSYAPLTQSNREYVLMRRALRAITGGTIDGATAWELMPWSWLADYFGNVGEYFQASRNIVGLVLNDVAVMRHTVTRASFGGKSADDWSMSSFEAKRETKSRKTSFVAPTLSSNPFLNANQMGIVASLAATRYT